MREWIVYSKDGLTERCRLKKLEYSGSFMNERAVTSTLVSPVEIAFDVFDYIEYRGEQFELEAIPTVKKTSSFSYEYDLRFVSYKYELERCEMRDIVPHDNGVIYPTPLTFSFTGDVKYLAERIHACLDAMYGSGAWNIHIAEGVTSDEHDITISQQNCWNALALVNTTYKLNFYIKGRDITIGGSQPVVGHTFQYGKGNGLYEIERTANADTGIVTKLRAYGSTRNLDYSYPKRPDWSDSALDTSFVLSPLRLMLPSFKIDGKTDFIMASDSLVAQYGVRESSIVYEDIYPSITGATYNGRNIDEIESVGEIGESTFMIGLYDLGFDLEEHLTTDTAQISMKSGALQGYTFNVQKVEKREDNSYILTLERITLSESDSGNYNVPTSDWKMSAGDKFVLLNILMPQAYIRDAEERLQARAEEYLAQYAKTNFGYNIGIHDKFLIENPSIYEELIEGSRLNIYDEELGISENVTIQSVTITENMDESILPQVKVVLNNEPSASTLERIQGQINDLSNGVSGGYSKQGDVLNQYRRKLDRPYFDKLFVAVDKDGKEIPSNDLTTEVYYIKARYHLATVGGFTSFIDDGFQDLPSIYDGLPIDNQTLYWEEENGVKLLKAKGGGSGEGGGTLSGITIEGDGNAFTEATLSDDGSSIVFTRGLTFVEKPYVDENFYDKTYVDNSFYTKTYSDENFAKASDFDALQTSFDDFLNGEDVDTTINKWKELEAFLSNMTESDNLATILSNKAETSALEELSKVVDTKWTKDDTKISNWDTAFGWGDHSKAGYALKTYVDAAFVGIKGDYTIEGTKNFIGELQVNGCPIVYVKTANGGYWKFEGDILATGGITSFGDDTAFTPSTIMDGLVLDPSTLGFKTTTDSNGNVIKQLTVIGGTSGGTGGLGEDDVKSIIESYGYLTSSDLPTFDSSDFSVSSSGMVSLAGARVEVVSSTDSMDETGVLYVIV